LEIDRILGRECFEYPPPDGNHLRDPCEVGRGCHHGHLIQGATVNRQLPGEAVEGIALALDLVPRQEAVYDSDINAGLALAQTQLLDDAGFGIIVLYAQPAQQRGSDVTVTHGAARS